MKSWIGSTACSRTSSDGASASCTASDASTWTGSSSNGRSDGTGGDGAARASSRCSTRASDRDPRPGRASPQPKPDRTPLRIARSDPGRKPPRTAALYLIARSAAGSFEIAPKAARNGRTSINSDEFPSRNPGSGETQHVVAADSKQ